jgi:RND family efflux transporter MFP subunit
MKKDLTVAYNNLKFIREVAGETPYYANLSADDKASLDTHRSNVNTALANLISAKQDIESDSAAILQAQNSLESIKATPRTTDIAVYQAQIKQAQASLQEIQAQIRKKQVIAPISGTVTQVNAKVGSIMSPTDIAASIISSGEFQIESYVPEIYVALVKVGNEAQVTLDAYGQERKFMARVVSIDPSQTLKDGVSTYKTKLQFIDNTQEPKDGMSANVVIITSKKDNVIAVPQGLILIKDDKRFVRIMRGEEIIEQEVVIGDISSSGQVEIISGLFENDTLEIK